MQTIGVSDALAANSVCSLSRLRERGGERAGIETARACPLPVPPPQAGEGTPWHRPSHRKHRAHVWRPLALALLVFAWHASPASAQQLTPFRVGVSDAVNTALPLWMAEAGGFYAANGLKVEVINMGGGSRGAQELQAGRIDLMRVGLSSVVQANRAGGDLRLIASMSNVIRFVVVTAPGVRAAMDLKGGVIGVSTFGSESDSTISIALNRWGLTRNDVVVKEYGGGSRRLAAVKSGEIKATAINEPTTSQARQEGVNVMIDLAAEQIPWLFSGVVVRRGDLAKPGTIVRFLKAVIEGNHLALTNAPLAKSVLAKELKLTDQTIVDISYDDFKAQSPPNMEPSMKGAENVLAQVGGTGSKALADYIDTGIIDALRAEGYFASLEQKYGKR